MPITAAFRIPSIVDLEGALRTSISLTAEARMRQADAAELYDNDDAYGRARCLAAYEHGLAAFWTTAKYHSQKACSLQIAAHQMPLNRALAFAYGPGADWIAALDTLVPLNELAAAVLSAQYAEYGVWLDEDELLMRRMRRMPV